MANSAILLRHTSGGCGIVVERRSVTGELSLSYARPAADGWPVNVEYKSAN